MRSWILLLDCSVLQWEIVTWYLLETPETTTADQTSWRQNYIQNEFFSAKREHLLTVETNGPCEWTIFRGGYSELALPIEISACMGMVYTRYWSRKNPPATLNSWELEKWLKMKKKILLLNINELQFTCSHRGGMKSLYPHKDLVQTCAGSVHAASVSVTS